MKEKIIYKAELHWVSYLYPIIKLTFAILIYSIIHLVFFRRGIGNTSIITNEYLNKGVLIFFTFSSIKNIYRFIYLFSIKIYISQKSISIEQGIFTKNITDILLTKYEGTALYQSVFGRLLNYGTLVITTGGVTSNFKIKNPLDFRKNIINQI